MSNLDDQPVIQKTIHKKQTTNISWLWDVGIIVVLLIAAYFRFTGIRWDENFHLHPDERFLTMVETAITPVEKASDYFNTSTSSLNPNNRGYTFYVYGTLPIFIVRYVGEIFGQTGYDQINVVGRIVSGSFDLGTILMLFLIARKLYKNSKLAILAALFSAFSVLQIQLSHYFTVDNVANFFVYAAIYCAICIMTKEGLDQKSEVNDERSVPLTWKDLTSHWHNSGFYILFGILYGMALASKVSIFALAALLPIASFIYVKRISKENRNIEIAYIIRDLIIAGLLALVTFRIFQPYAFLGPGFFGVKINPGWISSLKELSTISSGTVDVPYALQWARRPLTFAFENIVKWGLGIPLGILAFCGFVWMGWRIIKGDWQKHLLLWLWVAFVFFSQSFNWVRSMRYQLPIYPALVLIAAWTIFRLWKIGTCGVRKVTVIHFNWRKTLAVVSCIVVIISSGLWAFAFSRIYTRPVTRVAASEWIYENVSGAINPVINSVTGETIKQSLAFQRTAFITSDNPYIYGFTAKEDETIESITLEYVLSQSVDGNIYTLIGSIRQPDQSIEDFKGMGYYQSTFQNPANARGETSTIKFETPAQLKKGTYYELIIEVSEMGASLKLDGSVWMTSNQQNGTKNHYLPDPAFRLTQDNSYQVSFIPNASGVISEIQLNHVVDLLGLETEKSVTAKITNVAEPEKVLATGSLTGNFLAQKDVRGEKYTLPLKNPIQVSTDQMYSLELSVSEGAGALSLYNDTTAIESTWDDSLPLGMYGYNLYGYETGIFGNTRNMELYWDDTVTKRNLIFSTLDQTDYIFISSNRQWGTIPRVPERYPLTSEYYRSLIGCPKEENILTCYSEAEPGMYIGELGFDLVVVFQSDPNLGLVKINDQYAEEAFTVYDHPKVLIFEKNNAYDGQKVREILGSVDISRAVHKTPKQASDFKTNLYLDEKSLKIQSEGGTFNELFPADSALNTKPWLAAVIWYLAISLLGFLSYPIARYVFHCLPDKGYPLSRLSGLILVAYFTWLASSTGAHFSRLTIAIVMGLLIIVSGFLAYQQRYELQQEIKSKSRYFLTVEAVVLGLFLISLGIRLGNPDLWHPWKGGEKPMDLSYFLAVLKSTKFPPYDPWFSGGYINYYYFGFILVAVPVKFLQILPSISYNLIIPTLFALTGIGAFSIGWNLFAYKSEDEIRETTADRAVFSRNLFAGFASTFAVLIMGNLGTLRMLWQGIEKLAAPGGIIDTGSFFERFGWFFSGLGKFLTSAKLSYGYGDWYWIPSRAIPGDVITEFPFFTFTYADLHAHMLALPITILVCAWGLSFLLGKWNWCNLTGIKKWSLIAGTLLFGGISIGMLWVTNSWDLPTFLALSAVVIIYSIFRYAQIPNWFLPRQSKWLRKSIYSGLILLLLVGMIKLLYIPFSRYYGQAYSDVDPWQGDHSPLGSFLVHWGFQLFIIITWFIWETREWLASTPVSALKKLKPYLGYIQVLLVLFLLVLVLLTVLKVSIGWLVGTLAVWALILILRPDQPDVKRLVLFCIGTAMVITIFVELFALVGDIGRMNTVFKLYYQAWTLLGLSSAAALMWLVPSINTVWNRKWSSIWQIIFAVLVFSVTLFPVTAAIDKIRDRMSPETPATLDGLEFMKTSTYYDQNVVMDLNQDYEGILWMQQKVVGSPVIMEANTVEYRWGNRYTIYTGLPGVLGWNWHQRQQRGFLNYEDISARLMDIPTFYTTTDIEDALSIIKKYQVKYIILGQQERAYYPGEGLNKFPEYEGVYWNKVYGELDTAIYEVIY